LGSSCESQEHVEDTFSEKPSDYIVS
jgi:hypothetical protein